MPSSPTNTFLAYIDESGDEGFKFGLGSSEWFVLSALIVRRSIERTELSVVGEVKKRLRKTKPLHFQNLRHQQRLLFISELAKMQVRTASVLVHKPSIEAPQTFKARHNGKTTFRINELDDARWKAITGKNAVGEKRR